MKKLTLLLLLAFSVRAQAQQVIPLYSGKAPGSENWTWQEAESTQNLFKKRVLYNVASPTLTAYLPAKEQATGAAVIICPGGGFQVLSIGGEGEDVAMWLQARGVAAFVLKYRLVHSLTNDPVKELVSHLGNDQKHNAAIATVVPLAIADGKKAVEYVRTHAPEWGIIPNRVGLLGFSAGGMVTAGVGYSYSAANRPDFLAPIYADLGALLKQPVPADAPPLFVLAASNDPLGLAPQSVQLYSNWLAARKPAELHMYAKGGHGFGMGKQNLPTDTWIDRFWDWLKQQGFLTAAPH